MINEYLANKKYSLFIVNYSLSSDDDFREADDFVA